MKYSYTRALSDTELSAHLRSQDQIVLRVDGLRWQDVERQVERLGFGDLFMVAMSRGKQGDCCRINPASPLQPHAPDEAAAKQ